MLSIDLEFTPYELRPASKDSFIRVTDPQIASCIFCLSVMNGIMKVEPWQGLLDTGNEQSASRKATVKDVLAALAPAQIQRAIALKLGSEGAKAFLDAANEKAKRLGLEPIRHMLSLENASTGQCFKGSAKVLRLRR
jgi:hypothetical protein